MQQHDRSQVVCRKREAKIKNYKLIVNCNYISHPLRTTMGKQYISTNSVDNAHALDILDVAITNKYTVTGSSDGTVKFWDNKLDEIKNPKDNVTEVLIDQSGVHHLDVYENILPNSHIKVTILGYGCFNGLIKFQSFIGDDVSSIEFIDTPEELNKLSWIPRFYKDPESVEDYLVASKINGSIILYRLDLTVDETSANNKLSIGFTKLNTSDAKESSFPISLDLTQTVDKKLAVGYTNGDVLLYDLVNLKAIYTFHSTDLQLSGKHQVSNSVPRVVRFSPGGSLLVVARDNQNAGSITMYDVKYGENVGSLTIPSNSSKTTIGGFAHDGWIMGLSFDDEGRFLASCGFDKCVRVWNLDNKEREATINLSISDFENTDSDEMDSSVASGIKFIKKGIRGGAGGDTNDGLCVISLDRGVRWYREAGGI